MMPSGQGKSRVIACLIAIRAHEKTNYKQEGFTIVFSSKLLRDVDKAKYEFLATAFEANLKMIVYDPRYSLDSQVGGEKRCILIDEADMILLDNAAMLKNLHVYGLSATSLGTTHTEKQFLTTFNF